MSEYLRPTAPIAPTALLVDDPKRAMDLASALTEGPLMSNLAHGLWGYHGRTAAGAELTVQSTGIGGPSAAAVIADLAGHGVSESVRVGTCTALSDSLEAGQVVVVSAAIAADGVGAALGGGSIAADEAMTEALAETFGSRSEVVVSVDLPEPSTAVAEALAQGAVAMDLSTAAALGVARRANVRCGAVLVVDGVAGRRLGDERLDAAVMRAGGLAAGVLAPVAQA